MQYLARLTFFLLIFIVSSCGWHSQNLPKILSQVKVIKLNSLNVDKPLISSIRKQLRFYGIETLKEESKYKNITSITILKLTITQERASVSYNTNTSEYLLIMSVNANILIPHRGVYPIKNTVCRSFFDNFQTNLAKSIEREFIINEMYDRVAEELLRILLKISDNKFKTC